LEENYGGQSNIEEVYTCALYSDGWEAEIRLVPIPVEVTAM